MSLKIMSRKIDPLAAEARMISAGLQPLEPYKSAISDWKCKCVTCKNEVISRYNRVQQGSGCPICAYKAGGIKIRLSEEKALKKLSEYNLEALEPYEKSDINWKCRCLLCSEIVFPKLKNLQHGDGGCYSCGMKKAGQKNTLTQGEAILIVSTAGFEPLEPYKNALSKWKLRHKICNSIVYTNLNSIHGKSVDRLGCAVCAGKQVQKGLNDLVTTHPQISLEATGWDPTEVTAGSNKKKTWECENGHKWKAAIADRTGKHKSGCPTCATGGFDPNSKAYFYLLDHPHWMMLQIGISNDIKRRLSEHQKNGWKVIEIRGPMDGQLTQEIESAVLKMLKAKGADLSNKEVAGKFDGYSEAWSKSTFPVKSIRELMQLTEEFEGN